MGVGVVAVLVLLWALIADPGGISPLQGTAPERVDARSEPVEPVEPVEPPESTASATSTTKGAELSVGAAKNVAATSRTETATTSPRTADARSPATPSGSLTGASNQPSGPTGTSPTIPTPTTPPATTAPATAPPTVPPTVPPTILQTYSSPGGSVSIAFTNGALSLVSADAAFLFTATIENAGPQRIDVRFRALLVEWRIRVDVENGQIVPRITSS